jgi:hypothetical protein
MNLFIQIENGQPINHPAFEDNLMQIYNVIPDHWEQFVRVAQPISGVYEILESNHPSYQKVDGVWTDVWSLRPMTEIEIAAKQQVVKDAWAARDQAENWSAWIFDESTCSYIPPVPRPEPVEGENVFWCGTENNWKKAPKYPNDGKQYQFDFFEWRWKENIIEDNI